MSLTARTKDILRASLGDVLTAKIHGARFARMASKAVAAKPELLLGQRFVTRGAVAIDIGANGADWTLMMSRAVGEYGRVLAFEAHPYYAMATENAIRKLKLDNVDFMPLAVGAAKGQVELSTRPEKGASYSGKAHIVGAAASDRKHLVTIQMTTLDNYAVENDLVSAVGFIKIDTEGYELPILEGATETLRESRPAVILEVGHGWELGFSDDDIQQLIDELDYCCYEMDEEWMEVRPLKRIHADERGEVYNRLILPKEKAFMATK